MFGSAIWLRVTALARRAAALVVNCVRSILWSSRRRRWMAAVWTSIAQLPLVWQQLLDPAVQLRGQPGEDILQVVGPAKFRPV